MKNPSPQPRCSFCNCGVADVVWLFRSPNGAEPPHICDACVMERASWIIEDQKTPGFLAGVIAIQKAKIAERWAESHPAERVAL